MTNEEQLFKVDLDHLTVIRYNEHGEMFDLNAHGEPCTDLTDLRVLICELCYYGFFSLQTRNRLLAATK